MSSIYEVLSPGGHEVMAESIFSKLKSYLDANPYGYLTSHQDISGKVNKSGDTMTGALTITANNTGLTLKPASGEGGELHLDASDANAAQAGIILDQYDSKLRIFGIPSADGTTKTGGGTVLSIDPYSKNISGGYTFSGRATESYVPRVVNKDSQFKPGANTSVVKEFNSSSSNLPSADWYHIYTSEGSDTKYAVQLALGMSTTGAYYRHCANNTWSGWSKLAIHNKSDHLAPISNGTRLESADQQGDYNASLFTFMATGSMTTNKPPEDAHIIHSCWDNNGGWDVQLAIGHSNAIYTRSMNGGTWTAWKKYAYSDHTHPYLPLSGGTMTGSILLKGTNLNKDSNITGWCKELDFCDTNNKIIGLINVKQYGVRKMELHLGCIDGNKNWNEIVLKNDASVSYYAVTSPINFRSAIGAAASSSKLTKTNIQDMTDNEAKKILDIDVKSFDYKEGFVQPTDIKEKYYGVIAEECLEKIPYAVNVPEGYDEKEFDESKGLEQKLLLMDYPNFVPYLIKMVQIQQREIDELRERVG